MSDAFFRIRRKFANENKYGKFISVAVVEMVLIIVGILIALQIDNWNQKKQERKIINDYIAIIKHNVADDLKSLEGIIEYRKQSLLYTDTILGYYKNEQILNPKLFELGFISLFVEQRFIPNRNAYESLKSSGFLRNLGSTNIEEALSAYYSLLGRIVTNEEVFNSLTLPIEENLSENGFYIEYADMFLWNHQDTLDFTYDDLRKYPDVQSTFIRSKMWLESFIDLYTELFDIGEVLLEVLNSMD